MAQPSVLTKLKQGRAAFVALTAAFFLVGATAAPAAGLPKPGVNLSGGEFNATGSRRGIDYEYPRDEEVLAAARAGFRVVRLPFLAKRLLSVHQASRDATDIERVVALVETAERAGLTVVLDMHDYGFSREGEVIGRSEDSTRSFATSWFAIASIFREHSNVIFGLMNEPHYQSPAQWRSAVNLAIAAIRSTGATQGILVPSTDWSIASRWSQNNNPDEMLKIVDPLNNFAFEVHQYLDHDESGTHESVREGIGATSLIEFTNWARSNGKRAFLGEFAWAKDTAAEREGRALLAFVDANADVWAGWAVWGGGARWGNYMFALDLSGGSKPQMRVLKPYLERQMASDQRR